MLNGNSLISFVLGGRNIVRINMELCILISVLVLFISWICFFKVWVVMLIRMICFLNCLVIVIDKFSLFIINRLCFFEYRIICEELDVWNDVCFSFNFILINILKCCIYLLVKEI